MTGSAQQLPTRRECRRQDRHDAILAVAAQYFFDHGYGGTTMSAIAAAMGGSKGTLWSYFRSKEELFEAVIDKETSEFRARLSTILDPCSDLRQTLQRFCEGLIERVTSPRAIALHRLVVGEAGRSPEVGQIFYKRAPKLTFELLGGFLSGAMDREQLQRDDPVIAARLLLTMCMAGSHQKLLMGMIEDATGDAIVQDVERALDFFFSRYGIAT